MIRRFLSLPPRPFLTAEWRNLAMLNFKIDPAILQPWLPAGTELDFWHGQSFISVVGFQFVDTRVLGVSIPFHRNFTEVNLRFYVRRQTLDGWRRGVVFIKELAPRAAISLTARLLYGENYLTVPMGHGIEFTDGDTMTPSRVFYQWKFKGRENRIDMRLAGAAGEVESGSEAEFITDHHWGYTRRSRNSTLEYLVEHPRWSVCPASEADFDCDTHQQYGRQFVEALARPPSSSFLVTGSSVNVFKGVAIIAPPIP